MAFAQAVDTRSPIVVRAAFTVRTDVPFRTGKPQVVEARHDLAMEGASGRRAYVLDEGWLFTYRMLPDGSRQIVEIAVAGDVIGLNGLLSGGGGALLAAAATTSVVRELTAAALADTVRRSPEAAVWLCATSARSHDLLVEHLVDVGRRPAIARVGHLLLELKHRLARVGLAGAAGYRCPLTQQVIADALGLTGIHVNRTLRQLRSAGLLFMSNGYVEIPDERRLARAVAFEAEDEAAFAPAPRAWPQASTVRPAGGRGGA